MAIGASCATWFEGRWQDGNTPILGAADHGAWLGTMVFDGARSFDGVTPDLDLHCARLIRSAQTMGLETHVEAGEVEALILDGIKRFDPATALYLRPMMWSREGSPSIIDPIPASTGFAICLEALPMPAAGPFSLTMSPYRRPSPDSAMNDAKASCHYANNARIMSEAKSRGFNNGLSLDQQGNVAETASTNVFIVHDGLVRTPVPNGTFLNGITRQRTIALLRDNGVTVEECSLQPEDIHSADEIFVTGNIGKVVPVTRFEDRELSSTDTGQQALSLYREYAHQTRKAA